MRKLIRLNRTAVWTLILAFAFVAAYHTDIVGQVAYNAERGKLRADKEYLAQIEPAEVACVEQLSHAFNIIAEAVKPSVVNISSMRDPASIAEELRDLFGDRDIQLPPITGSGSGVILDAAGFIVTNNHVVDGADRVQVGLIDGRKFTAEVIGADPMTDVAVVKIDADKLHPAHFGESNDVKVGHLVLAIGSPFRLTHSVSHGIVSALGRTDVAVDIDYKNWIQTDAAINPGNSGGPLINARGEVVGLNVAIATDSGGHQGVGFAIPSDTVIRIAETLKTGRNVVRGYLGVSIEPVDFRRARAYDLVEARGVFVAGVGADSPAERGGLKEEDIILKVNGVWMDTREQLQEYIAYTPPETDVDMLVWRDGRETLLKIRIGTQPTGFSTTGSIRSLDPEDDEDKPNDEEPAESDGGISPTANPDAGVEFKALGFAAANLPREDVRSLRRGHGIDHGVIITKVSPTSDAYICNLRRGQIIVQANDKEIRELSDLEAILTREALSKGVRLRVNWGGDTIYTVLQSR